MTSIGCIDNINSNILNRCVIVTHYEPLRKFTQSFFNIIYPTIITSVVIILITILPFIFDLSSRLLYKKSLRLYNIVRFTLMSLLHRVSYCYSFCSILRYLIKQPSPCTCGKYSTTKTLNMPYMYTFTSAIVSLTLFDFAQFSPIAFHSLAIFTGIVPNIFYWIDGYASLGQILATLFLAVFLHIYSSRTSNRVMLIEATILLILNLSFFIKIYKDNNSGDFSVRESPLSLMMRGSLCCFIVIAHDLCFLIENKWGYFTIKSGMLIVENEQTNVRSTIMSSDDEVNIFYRTIKNDKRNFVLIFLFTVFVKSIEYYLKSIQK